MKMDVAIIWDDGGDGSFEETIIAPWIRDGVTAGRMAATLELRGQGDVSDRFAESDAEGLYNWLCGCAVIDESVAPTDWPVEAVEMGHMETIIAPQPGVLIFEKELGDFVEEGQRFARILGRPGDPSTEVVLHAEQAGRLVTRYRDRLIPRAWAWRNSLVAGCRETGVAGCWTRTRDGPANIKHTKPVARELVGTLHRPAGSRSGPRFSSVRRCSQVLRRLRRRAGAMPHATGSVSHRFSVYSGGSIWSSTRFAVISASITLLEIPSRALRDPPSRWSTNWCTITSTEASVSTR